MRKVLLLGIIVVVGFYLAACDPGSDGAAPAQTSANTTIDTGAGSKDASADVVVGKTIKYDSLGYPTVDVTITNNSEKTSDYYVTFTLNSADGTEQLDDSAVFADGLKPGQVKKDHVTFIGIDNNNVPKKVVVTLEMVQRTASG